MSGSLTRLLPLCLCFGLGCGPAVALNEFVASNTTGITDSEGGTPDWIELVNTSPGAVSLDGWFLSDDESDPQRDALDGLVIPGGGYLLLMASGDVSLGEEHLSFRLSRDGETLLLSDGDTLVDSVEFGVQESDVALARVPDGVGEWAAVEPTPGASNTP